MTRRPDARRHPRFAVQIDAQVSLGEQTFTATTKDMSRGGICLFCPQKIEPGSNIDMSLSLVLGSDAFSESIRLSARVVWCTPVDDNYQVGAAFVEMDRMKTGQLYMFLRFLEQEIREKAAEPPEESTTPFDTGDSDSLEMDDANPFDPEDTKSS